MSLPLHKSMDLSGCGVYVKHIFGSAAEYPKLYPHIDDYYIFALFKGGNCVIDIDFREYSFSSGDAGLIKAGQVHRFVSAEDVVADVLMVDAVLVGEAECRAFGDFQDQRLPQADFSELEQILDLLSQRMENADYGFSRVAVQRLAEAFVAVAADSRQMELLPDPGKARCREIAWEFRRLFAANYRISRLPSFYADKLNISVSYLNEVMKKVTGASISHNIQDSIILMAKRRLAYTADPVKKIASDLGFDDYSYFTRLFTRTAGVSPTCFRDTYRG